MRKTLSNTDKTSLRATGPVEARVTVPCTRGSTTTLMLERVAEERSSQTAVNVGMIEVDLDPAAACERYAFRRGSLPVIRRGVLPRLGYACSTSQTWTPGAGE